MLAATILDNAVLEQQSNYCIVPNCVKVFSELMSSRCVNSADGACSSNYVIPIYDAGM